MIEWWKRVLRPVLGTIIIQHGRVISKSNLWAETTTSMRIHVISSISQGMGGRTTSRLEETMTEMGHILSRLTPLLVRQRWIGVTRTWSGYLFQRPIVWRSFHMNGIRLFTVLSPFTGLEDSTLDQATLGQVLIPGAILCCLPRKAASPYILLGGMRLSNGRSPDTAEPCILCTSYILPLNQLYIIGTSIYLG